MIEPRPIRSRLVRPGDAPAPRDEGGMALIMVLIFAVLLYAMISELVTTAQTARLIGENDVLLTRMRGHMDYVQTQVEDELLNDLAAAAEGGEREGAGLGGALGGMPGGGDAGGLGGLGEGGAPGEEEEPDPAAVADGSQDAWFEPVGHSDNEITTYVWVEDENRKFNLLTLVSPDEEFAQVSRERFVRLIDALRESTEYDVTRAVAETLADNIVSWMEGRTRSESIPRPPLKSDEDERTQISLPLQLDELLLLPDVDDALFFDLVLDGRVIQGLESVLTIYTSLVFDPGDPNDPNQARQLAERQAQQQGEGGEGAGEVPGGAAAGAGDGAGGAGSPGAAPAGGEPGEMQQPLGIGIRININTATRPVLRCLFSRGEIPDTVIDAILRWRNEPVEMEPGDLGVPDDYLGDVTLGSTEKLQMFTELTQLEEIPEFENLPDPKVKNDFIDLLTVNSDVFSIHLASMHRRNEETRTYVLQRARSVVMRVGEGDEPYLHPLILHEERHGLRIKPVDLPDDDLLSLATRLTQLDDFTQEERAWNPFYVDFYRPRDQRELLFDYQLNRR